MVLLYFSLQCCSAIASPPKASFHSEFLKNILEQPEEDRLALLESVEQDKKLEEKIRIVVGKILRETVETVADFLADVADPIQRFTITVTYPFVTTTLPMVEETIAKIKHAVLRLGGSLPSVVVAGYDELVQYVTECMDRVSAGWLEHSEAMESMGDSIDASFVRMCTKLLHDLRIYSDCSSSPC